MDYWHRLLAWLQEPRYDVYWVSAHENLAEVRKYCYKRYGEDGCIVNEQIGRRLQSCIDAMNNQGGLAAHKHALARWQIFKALYPEYISNEPPKIVKWIWLDPKVDD